MRWFRTLLECIFGSCDDDYNERIEVNRYRQPGQKTAVKRTSFRASQFDSKTRPLLRDHVNDSPVYFADVSSRTGPLPQLSKGKSITYEHYVHPQMQTTPPVVPITLPRLLAPPISLSSNTSTKTKLTLSSPSDPTTYSPTKTPSISKPLSSSSSHSSAEHSSKSSSSSAKPQLSTLSKPSTPPPKKAPSSKPWQPPPSPSSSSSSKESALPTFKPTLAPSSSSISRDLSGKTNYTWIEKGTKPWQPPPPSPSSSSSSKESALPTFKPTLARSSPSILRDLSGKTNYTWFEKGTKFYFGIPKDIAELLKRDAVPNVLYGPLSQSTYIEYFAALLYAEDFYCEKWSDYLLEDVLLELDPAYIYTRGETKYENERDDKTFVAFEITSVPERRPFLLSKDFVCLQPLDKSYSFQGVIYRVLKGKTVLAEFNEDFYAEHYPSRTYNVSFSFNRFCLKRAHQAIRDASSTLLQCFVFPADSIHRRSSSPTSDFFASKLDFKQKQVVSRILGIKGSPPFLVVDTVSGMNRSYPGTDPLSSALIVQEAIVHIVRIIPNSRILVCAPTNRSCDALMANLKKEIPESGMFRANAAFRERDEVPVELLPSCRYNDECFNCPTLEELKRFRVVSATFVSSYRLKGEGITAGHFTHIFLVDGSSVTEPELMIALATFANDDTTVVVTGSPNNQSGWVRSKIARDRGLRVSYFERLCKHPPYKESDPRFIARLES